MGDTFCVFLFDQRFGVKKNGLEDGSFVLAC